MVKVLLTAFLNTPCELFPKDNVINAPSLIPPDIPPHPLLLLPPHVRRSGRSPHHSSQHPSQSIPGPRTALLLFRRAPVGLLLCVSRRIRSSVLSRIRSARPHSITRWCRCKFRRTRSRLVKQPSFRLSSRLKVVHPTKPPGRRSLSSARTHPRLATCQTGTHRGAPHDAGRAALSQLFQVMPTYANPALPAIACHLYTLPDNDDLTTVASPSESYLADQKPILSMYGEPPMDSLPYPPPANTPSPSYFQSPRSPDGVALASPPFIHDASYTTRDHWEDRPPRLTMPTQSYMLSELPSPVSTAFSPTLPQQFAASSVTRSQRRHSRSPSPPLRLSPTPHTKRSLDKKPALACLFCRGRKIACGPPQPGSKDKTCK